MFLQFGNTALHKAARQGQSRAVRCLLMHAANVDTINTVYDLCLSVSFFLLNAYVMCSKLSPSIDCICIAPPAQLYVPGYC